jgi:hypothetical protein
MNANGERKYLVLGERRDGTAKYAKYAKWKRITLRGMPAEIFKEPRA